jgi:hypothetical protein
MRPALEFTDPTGIIDDIDSKAELIDVKLGEPVEEISMSDVLVNNFKYSQNLSTSMWSKSVDITTTFNSTKTCQLGSAVETKVKAGFGEVGVNLSVNVTDAESKTTSESTSVTYTQPSETIMVLPESSAVVKRFFHTRKINSARIKFSRTVKNPKVSYVQKMYPTFYDDDNTKECRSENKEPIKILDMFKVLDYKSVNEDYTINYDDDSITFYSYGTVNSSTVSNLCVFTGTVEDADKIKSYNECIASAKHKDIPAKNENENKDKSVDENDDKSKNLSLPLQALDNKTQNLGFALQADNDTSPKSDDNTGTNNCFQKIFK